VLVRDARAIKAMLFTLLAPCLAAGSARIAARQLATLFNTGSYRVPISGLSQDWAGPQIVRARARSQLIGRVSPEIRSSRSLMSSPASTQLVSMWHFSA